MKIEKTFCLLWFLSLATITTTVHFAGRSVGRTVEGTRSVLIVSSAPPPAVAVRSIGNTYILQSTGEGTGLQEMAQGREAS